MIPSLACMDVWEFGESRKGDYICIQRPSHPSWKTGEGGILLLFGGVCRGPLYLVQPQFSHFYVLNIYNACDLSTTIC